MIDSISVERYQASKVDVSAAEWRMWLEKNNNKSKSNGKVEKSKVDQSNGKVDAELDDGLKKRKKKKAQSK